MSIYVSVYFIGLTKKSNYHRLETDFRSLLKLILSPSRYTPYNQKFKTKLQLYENREMVE